MSVRRLRGLNSRRRERRFKRRLRLRSSVCAARWLALVFDLFGGFILPFAFAVAVCAVVYVRARDSIYAQYERGGRVFEVPRRGGVSPPRTILTVVYSKTQTIRLPAERAGIRGRGAAGWGVKSPLKIFCKKRLTLGQTGCILGVEKDERARNGRLESQNRYAVL